MFRVSYKFKAGGPEYNCTYPDKKDINNNIFIVKGGSDKGKSTLMQMIALGLFGLDSEDISPDLKDKMKSLLDPEYVEKCEFEYIISSVDGKITLNVSCKSRSINTLVNDQKKGSTYIHENFKLLFDVPENPLVKLNIALKSVKASLQEYETLTRKYQRELYDILDRIKNYEDKEKRLDEEQKELDREKKEKENLEEYLEELKIREEELRKAYVVIIYEKYFKEFENLEKSRRDIEKKIKKLKSAGVGGGDKKYHNLRQAFLQALSDLKFSVNNAIKLEQALEEKEKESLKIFAKQINSTFSIQDIDEGKLKRWRKYVKYLLNEIKSSGMVDIKLPQEDELNLVKKLIEILEEFIEIETTIPGTGKNVREYISILKKRKEEIEAELSEKLIVEKATEECFEILQNLDKIAEERAKLPKVESKSEEDLDELVKQKDEIINKMDNITKNLDSLEDEYNSIPEKEKYRYDTEKLKEYGDIKNKINSIEDKIRQYEMKTQAKIELINSLKKIEKKPKYDKNKLRSEYNITSKILQKIEDWLRYVNDLDLKRGIEKSKITDNVILFYDALSDYFAGILDFVYYEHRKWKVKKINFIKNCYEVEGRGPISFQRIGTGHTSLNSLMPLLKQDYGGRKKIVLFDEIGLMDDDVLGVLLQEIKRQVRKGEILFCILAKAESGLDKVIFEPVPI